MKADEVIKLDKQFQKNGGMGNIDTKETKFSTYRILDNKKKIMISAPHSIKHERKGKILPQDKLTGGLALYLQKSLKIPIIYATSYKVGDPNYDRNNDSEYKNTLAKYIKKENIQMLIDLHGCRTFRDFCIELGTGGESNQNLLGHDKIIDIIEKTLNKNLNTYIKHSNKKITKNTIFPASRETTVSSFISHECNIPTIQLEFNKDLRDFNNKKKYNNFS